MIIVGAGFAGLIAAHIWQRATLVESAAEPRQAHKALLRFRSDAIGKLIGIDFRKVRVHKGIWNDERFVAPNIRVANLYADKCTGTFHGDRSIWNIDAVDRWVAPETLYEQMLETLYPRVKWNCAYDFPFGEPVVSTAPMPIVLKACGVPFHQSQFQRAPITVERYRLRKADVYQTIYFPTFEHSVYRASITGSLLIIEHAGEPHGNWLEDVVHAFGINNSLALELIDQARQSYGKIVPLPETLRKKWMYDLTTDRNIYSFGRFATWRNLLLDDLLQDAAVIKLLINREHNYDLAALTAR